MCPGSSNMWQQDVNPMAGVAAYANQTLEALAVCITEQLERQSGGQPLSLSQ